MKKRSWVACLVTFVLAVIILAPLGAGTLYNYDDTLYAVIMREVSRGQLFPLTFSGEIYEAKPPLAFWLGGFFIRFLGNHEFSYRMLSALSFLSILLAVFFAIRKSKSLIISIVALLLLLGSPILSTFSHRVMLDLPLAAIGIALLIVAASESRLQSLWIWSLAGLGWWIKGIAILPALVAALCGIFLTSRTKLLKVRFWLTSLPFLASVGLLQILRMTSGHQALPGLAPVKAESLVMPAPRDIYLDVLISDTIFYWLVPFVGIWIVMKHKSVGRLGLYLTLGCFFHWLALLLTKTILPYYTIPVYAYGLPIIAIGIHQIKIKRIKVVVLALVALQAIFSNLFRLSADNPDINPAPATKHLARVAVKQIDRAEPLCVVDTYFVGFRFYSDRTTLGFYTSQRAYDAHYRVLEFQKFVAKIEQKDLPIHISKKCGGMAIMPTRLAEMYSNAQIVETQAPLSLVRFQSI